MKKFVVLLVVVAMTCFSAAAFAADVTMGGAVQVRSRDFSNMNMWKDLDATATNNADQRDTQERVEVDINAKAGDVKGKIAVWNDFDTWGKEAPASGSTAAVPAGPAPNLNASLESEQGQGNNPGAGRLGIREAWVNFNLPVLPLNITAGHQLLQLGDGWFFRNMHFGSDAWVVANVTGNNTAAFVNVKVTEGATARADDVDAYVLLDVFKINDNNTVGANLTQVHDRMGALGIATGGPASPGSELDNLGLNYNGKIGIVALKGQVDLQGGKVKAVGATAEKKFKGNEIVIQGSVPVNPVTIRFTVAQGSGNKAGDTDVKGYVNFMDIDPHYTFMYEYKIPTAAGGAKNTGFSNTRAIGVGATMAASQSVTVGADIWSLTATEKTNVSQTGAAHTNLSDKIGTELDVQVNWKLADNLTWNWNLGYFKPGDAYKDDNGHGTDAATGIQGILAFNF